MIEARVILQLTAAWLGKHLVGMLIDVGWRLATYN